MPAKREFKAREVSAIVKQYEKGGPGNGLEALAEKHEAGVGVIRRVLVEAGVKLRGRGRPRKNGSAVKSKSKARKSRKTRAANTTPAVPKRKVDAAAKV